MRVVPIVLRVPAIVVALGTASLPIAASTPMPRTSITDPEPGVPASLAAARRLAVSSVSYALHFRIPAERTAPVEGTVTIVASLQQPRDRLVIDFAGPAAGIRALTVNGRPATPRVAGGHIVLAEDALVDGRNEIAIGFTAGDGPLNRGDDFMYTLFVPARAHHVFPCFDQPDLKARVALTLDLPAGWQAVANGAERDRHEEGGRARVRFAETPPIATYLVAFAAGRLEIERADRGGRTYRMFHRETDAQKISRNRDAIFDLHAFALQWMEEYTGIRYPWHKFDFFAVPAFQFGGMEHPGTILYNAPVLLLEESATTNQLLGRASLIAHETAHMWFGDLVTMRWFDDVWMKEVFANYFAARIVNPSFPAVNHDLRFLLSHYPAAYAVDRTPGTHPIRQPLGNLNEAGTLYGAIIYQKAPVVVRQLERLTGEEGLRAGLREYLRRYSFANASWPDLIALLDPAVDVDLAAWSAAWVTEAGRPVVRTELVLDDRGAIGTLALVQDDPLERGLVWPQALEVVVAGDQEFRTVAVRLDRRRVEVAEAAGTSAPRFVLPAGGGLGYALFELDPASREALLSSLPGIGDPLTRGSAWLSLWELMLEGRVAADVMFELALRALDTEADELNVQRLLDDAATLYWRFLVRDRRDAAAVTLERVLLDGLERAEGSTRKAAWFQALVRVSRTPPTLAWLTRVWRQEAIVPGLTLDEPDYTRLAQELALREVAGWRELLDAQQARILNPDRKARFAFVRPSLDADRVERDRFFASLADVANRRHEPWVLEAVAYLHHPLRSAEAERYVSPSLALLDEIQRTGDIFFPRRWTDATLHGHNSPEVAAMVRRFLSERETLRPRLRQIVLQAADELFRAVRMASPPEGHAPDGRRVQPVAQ